MTERTLRIQPRNPADFREGEIEQLRVALAGAMPRTYRVVVTEPPPQMGRGVTYYEIVQMWLLLEPYAKTLAQHFVLKALDKATSAFVAWVRTKRKKKDNSRRPTYAVILGPHEEVLRAILVDSDGKVIDKTAEEIRFRQPIAPPPVVDMPANPKEGKRKRR